MNVVGNFRPSKCKWYLEITLGKMLQPNASSELDKSMPYIRAANVHWGRVDQNDLKEMWFSPSEIGKYTLRNKDLVVLEGGDVGRCAILKETPQELGFQNSIHRVRVRKGIEIRFVYYWMIHLKSLGYFDLICSKATIAHLTGEKFAETPFPVIDFASQQAIADFLDRETARIDRLIEKKQRLVELVEEKRSALIIVAITGQIDPETGENQSLIQRVPAGGGGVTNWDGMVRSLLQPLKRCCHVNPAVLSEATDPDWEFDYIDIGGVSLAGGVTRKERMRFSASPSRARKSVSEGDVLVATVRTYLKAIAAIQQSDIPQVASTGFSVLRAREQTEPRFLYRIVQSSPFVEQIVAQSAGVSYPAINPSKLSNIKIPLPDIETQMAIADFLDCETALLDKVRMKTVASIDRLREYRSALITAVVMGQIDVAA